MKWKEKYKHKNIYQKHTENLLENAQREEGKNFFCIFGFVF